MAHKIGYIGLGNIGTPIFINLAKHASSSGLPAPTVWNRTPAKYDAVRTELATAPTSGSAIDVYYAKEITEVVERSNVIFTSLLNDAAAEETYTKLFAAVKGDKEKIVFVDQSSIKPITSIKLEEQAHKVGAGYLSAPIFGRPDAARAAKLIHVIAGEPSAKEFVKPLLQPALARLIIDAGNKVAKGTGLKLLGNSLILSAIEAMGEAYALADAIELDPSVFQHFIREFFPTPSYVAYGDKISTGNFDGTGGFRVEGGLKDARNVLSLGEELGRPVEMPIMELAKTHLERAEELGGKDMDWSALAITLREKAGFQPFREGSKH